MTKLGLYGALVASALIASARLDAQATTNATTKDTTTASKLYLNYDVPESPAFDVLGVSPTNVTRASGAKPVVINLLRDGLTGTKVASGLALDVAPFAYFERFSSRQDYIDNSGKRWRSKILLSFATANAADTNSIRFATGLRMQLHDDHDLLANTTLGDDVAKALIPKKIVCETIPGTNICKKSADEGTEVDLSDPYKKARELVAAKKGYALAIGGAGGGTLLHAIPNSDSLKQGVGRAWLSGTWYMGGGSQLLGTGQWAKDTTGANTGRIGVAYRLASAASDLSAEAAFEGSKFTTMKFLPGLNAAFRILKGIDVVGALVMDPGDRNTKPHLRFKTSFKWSATEGS